MMAETAGPSPDKKRVTSSMASLSSSNREQLTGWLDLAKLLLRTLKTVVIHEINNAAVKRLIEELVKRLNENVQNEGSVSLQQSDKKIFINKTVLQADVSFYMILRELVNVLDTKGIGGLTINEEIPFETMKEFLSLYKSTVVESDKTFFECFEKGLRQAGISQIVINRPLGITGKSDEDMTLDRGQLAHYLYAKALIYLRKYMANADTQTTKAIFANKCVRTIQDLVDLCGQRQQYLLGLITIKYFEEFLFHHSVNVAILAILLGQKLGFSKAQLADLGMCGLFHDVGLLIRIEGENQQDDTRLHPLSGAAFMVRDKRVNENMIRRIVVLFEHHFDFDRNNVPAAYSRFEHDLFTRIIRIVDTYDLLTTGGGRQTPELPDRALAKMMEQSGKKFDPALLKVFINTICIFPVGTTVLLNTGEIGVVYHSQQDPAHFNEPQVKLVRKMNGTPLNGEIVDLGHQPASSKKRVIIRSMDPNNLGINVSHYLLG